MKDNAAGVIADVRRIRSHPLIPKSIPIYGYIFTTSEGGHWRKFPERWRPAKLGNPFGTGRRLTRRPTFAIRRAVLLGDSRSEGSDASTGPPGRGVVLCGGRIRRPSPVGARTARKTQMAAQAVGRSARGARRRPFVAIHVVADDCMVNGQPR
jgi:hypothetical protein